MPMKIESAEFEDLRRRVRSAGIRVAYKVGQKLSDGEYIPGNILIIEQGYARLLGRDQGRLVSVAKLQAGELVGAASHLHKFALEEIRAGSELIATSIDEESFHRILEEDSSARSAIYNNLFPSELLAVLLDNARVRYDFGIKSLFRKAADSAFACSLSDMEQLNVALESGFQLFVPLLTTGDRDKKLFKCLTSIKEIESVTSKATFKCPKVIAIKRELFCLDSKSSLETTESASVAPDVSTFNSEIASDQYFVAANGAVEEVIACFRMLSKLIDIPFRKDGVERVLKEQISRGQQPNLRLCGQIAAGLGLHVSGARVDADMGNRLLTPTLLKWKEGIAVAVRSDKGGLVLASPSQGIITLKKDAFIDNFPEGIELLVIDKTNTTPKKKFGPSWFWPALRRYRSVLVQVLAASFVVQLFTLANPLLIQVIIDKVISQRSLDTLEVLGIALLAVTVLEGVLGSLKTFLFAETTNRIDQRLGAEAIDHLLRLPLNYFDKRPVGELGSRISELEKIRNFLTGQALNTLLDAAFSMIYILVMIIYSWLLTLIALSVLPIQVGLTLFGAPLFRSQYRKAAEANAETQSHLVEVLTGIQTIKSQNVEMVSRQTWQNRYSQYIKNSFEQTITGTAVSQSSQVLQKISQLLVLWVGARLVLSGEMTLGQLIAFRIISGYVTQPILRLSSIWQSIQELRVSFERLADIIDTPSESNDLDRQNIPLPSIKGEVEFHSCYFTFPGSRNEVLKNINLKINPGMFVGIVGQSGSGKSSLMKLLPRLYSPTSGNILLDGYDIDKVELYSLRRQIGIVPQDPLLFSGSISSNISLTRPDASSDEIVQAAKAACAHEFIMQMPNGYSSEVGERGASLSGGQRQRIAIARTLLANPKLLVMDEATSALDYATERRVCDSLKSRQSDSTVFFVTHRLPTVRNSDLIVVMHNGIIEETGTHSELMDLRGRYFALYRQQEGS